jgi:hypothetical protein
MQSPLNEETFGIIFLLLLTEFVLFFMSQSGQSEQELSWYQRKADLNSEIQNLKSKMRDSQVGFVILLLFHLDSL